MTTTDGEREIAKQLKRIADALAGPEEDTSFTDAPKPRRLAEGGYVTGERVISGGYCEINPEVWERIMREGQDLG